MLVGCRMKNDLRAMAQQQTLQAFGIADIRNEGHKRGSTTASLEHHLDVVDAVLPMAQQEQLLGATRQDLTAQLGANRTSRASHQDDCTGQQPVDGFEVSLHGLASKQVLNLHLADLADAHKVAQQLVEPGNRLGWHAAGSADFPHLANGRPRRCGHRNNDLVNATLSQQACDIVASAQDRHPIDLGIAFLGGIVHKPDGQVAQGRIVLHLTDSLRASIPCPDDERPLRRSLRLGATLKGPRPSLQESDEHSGVAHRHNVEHPLQKQNRP